MSKARISNDSYIWTLAVRKVGLESAEYCDWTIENGYLKGRLKTDGKLRWMIKI